MNDKSLEVLKQYEFNTYRISRGRGGMLIATNEGIKLFLECRKSDKYYKREDAITQALLEEGIVNTDTYIKNIEGDIFSDDSEGHRYIVKNWYDGKECNVKDLQDIRISVIELAKLHIALQKVSKNNKDSISFINKITNIKEVCIRHKKELKMASNYLRNKKNKSDFEQLAYHNIEKFYQEAQKAIELFNEPVLEQRLKQVNETCELSHGGFNYHNIIIGSEYCAITNFDKYKNECQISDLYQFMRKIMEKCDWSIELAYRILDDYNKVKPVSDDDLKLLSAMFAFPEKYWKIINYYFNSNKAWIPPKSYEKLIKVVQQNDKRRAFIETLID